MQLCQIEVVRNFLSKRLFVHLSWRRRQCRSAAKRMMPRLQKVRPQEHAILARRLRSSTVVLSAVRDDPDTVAAVMRASRRFCLLASVNIGVLMFLGSSCIHRTAHSYHTVSQAF